MRFDLGVILLAGLTSIDAHKHPTTEHEREVQRVLQAAAFHVRFYKVSSDSGLYLTNAVRTSCWVVHPLSQKGICETNSSRYPVSGPTRPFLCGRIRRSCNSRTTSQDCITPRPRIPSTRGWAWQNIYGVYAHLRDAYPEQYLCPCPRGNWRAVLSCWGTSDQAEYRRISGRLASGESSYPSIVLHFVEQIYFDCRDNLQWNRIGFIDLFRSSQFLDIGVIDVETCKPLPNVLIDIWQANATGIYAGRSHPLYSPLLTKPAFWKRSSRTPYTPQGRKAPHGGPSERVVESFSKDRAPRTVAVGCMANG